jgi:hypothetical protein
MSDAPPILVSDTPIDISKEWHVRTPDFLMHLLGETDDEWYRFKVVTNKCYVGGQRYQVYTLTKELISEPESKLIGVLSEMMQSDIDYLIANGDLKEKGEQ